MATPTLDLSGLDGSNGFRIDGAVVADYLGESVNNAGDVNGDGFDDLIIGAIGADPHGKSSGSSYVVFGKASGFDATLNVSTLDGKNGFRLDRFSSAVSPVSLPNTTEEPTVKSSNPSPLTSPALRITPPSCRKPLLPVMLDNSIVALKPDALANTI